MVGTYPEHNWVEEDDDWGGDIANDIFPPSTIRLLHWQVLRLTRLSSANLLATYALLTAGFGCNSLVFLSLSFALTYPTACMVDTVALPFRLREEEDKAKSDKCG